jgi:hypothetical protein
VAEQLVCAVDEIDVQSLTLLNPAKAGSHIVNQPAEGLRWRSDVNLKLNYIWLQNYSPDDPPGVSNSMKFDHVVAAKSYVGCLAPSAGRPSAPTGLRVAGP